MVQLPKIDELKSLFSFEEVPVGDYIYDLQIKSDVIEVAEKQVGSLFISFGSYIYSATYIAQNFIYYTIFYL